MADENAYRVITRKCPNCGAQIPFDAGDDYVCGYCNTHLTLVTPSTSPEPSRETEPAAEKTLSQSVKQQRPDTQYEQQTDPSEGAFSVLVPQNWHTTGGVERANAASWLGKLSPKSPARIDFTVMKDAQATVAIRWLPDTIYVDMQVSATGRIVGAMYPPGSNYSGYMVSPALPATQFLTQVIIPMVHSQAQRIEIVEQRPLAKIARDYQQRMTALNPAGSATYDAGLIVATYEENGVRFKETIFTVIENLGLRGDGKWGNKESLLVRTPESDYNEWLSTFSKIQQSVELNSQWLMNEVKSQFSLGFAMLNNTQVQMYVQGIIQNHRMTKQAVNAELFQDAA